MTHYDFVSRVPKKLVYLVSSVGKKKKNQSIWLSRGSGTSCWVVGRGNKLLDRVFRFCTGGLYRSGGRLHGTSGGVARARPGRWSEGSDRTKQWGHSDHTFDSASLWPQASYANSRQVFPEIKKGSRGWDNSNNSENLCPIVGIICTCCLGIWSNTSKRLSAVGVTGSAYVYSVSFFSPGPSLPFPLRLSFLLGSTPLTQVMH